MRSLEFRPDTIRTLSRIGNPLSESMETFLRLWTSGGKSSPIISGLEWWKKETKKEKRGEKIILRHPVQQDQLG